MDTRSDGTEPDLEPIDLEPIDLDNDAGAYERPPGRRASRRLVLTLGVSAAAVVIASSAFLAIRSGHHRGRSSKQAVAPTSLSSITTIAPVPIHSTEPLLGRFYPVIDHNDSTTIVLPTGQMFTLARGASAAIGGLGATFIGTVRPKGATCCALSFEVLHAAPSDVFATIGPKPRSVPVMISSTHAVLPDLREPRAEFGVLSTGDWTLIASYENGDHSIRANAITRRILGTWHVRSTPHGPVVSVPAGSTVDNSEVDFGRVPDISDRAVTFVRSVPCEIGTTPTYFDTATNTTARWCANGLAVTIQGPSSNVQRAVASLDIRP